MTELILIILALVFPISNAQAGEGLYTTYTIDPQSKVVIRCSLVKFKNEPVLICTSKPIKEIKK